MTKIHKQVYGQGQPIVLIHGWAMHSGIWREFAQQLAEHYQVICLDLPGHGLSETVEPYTLDAIVEALLDVMPESAVAVLGWSLGATVATAIAQRYPQRVNALILLAGNPRFVAEQDWPGMQAQLLLDFAENLRLHCQQTLIRFLALQVNKQDDAKTQLKRLRQAVQECDAPTEQVLKGGLDILMQADLRPFLIENSCPLQMILGEKDTLIPVEVGAGVQALNSEIKLHIIKRAGHVPFLSHTPELISIIKQSL